MITLIIIGLVVVYLFGLLLAYSMCRMAAWSDEEMEKME